MRHVIILGIVIALLPSLSGCVAKNATRGNSDHSRIIDLGNGVCQDSQTGLMWAKQRSRVIRDLNKARKYAGDLELAGHDDWRLPTIYELYDIHYLYDTNLKSDCAIELEGNYWSDEKDGEGMVGAWEIGSGCGPEREYFGKQSGYVMAIRTN